MEKTLLSLRLTLLMIWNVNCLLFLTMAFNNENKQCFILNVSTLNCHGLKSNIGYSKNLFNEKHVNFICEHWLQPQELSKNLSKA